MVQTVVFEQNCLQAQLGAKNVLQIPAQIRLIIKIIEITPIKHLTLDEERLRPIKGRVKQG